MLTFDIASLSARELEDIVARRCAQFGTVKSVRVLLPVEHRKYGIAVVGMSTSIETNRVIAEIGDLNFGFTALIRLMPERRRPRPRA